MSSVERPAAIRFAIAFGLVASDFDEVEASIGGHDSLVDCSAGRIQDVSAALFYPCRPCPARRELGGGVSVLADHDPAVRLYSCDERGRPLGIQSGSEPRDVDPRKAPSATNAEMPEARSTRSTIKLMNLPASPPPPMLRSSPRSPDKSGRRD